MGNWYNESTDGLCEALLSLKNKEECYAFLEDLCTVKEILEMSQRLSVAKLLHEGLNYAAIKSKTGVSTGTISRISNAYEYGKGGYKKVIDSCGGKSDD